MAVMLIPCGAGNIMQSALWKITEWILLFYEKGSGLLLELPGARWIPGRPRLWQIACYYGVLLFYLWRKKEGKERGQTNRETGGKTACDSWDPAHPAWDPKVETRADGADYAGCGTGRLFFSFRTETEKIT